MKRLVIGIIAFLVVVIIGGAVYLGTMDTPPPSSPVEKVLPDENFPK